MKDNEKQNNNSGRLASSERDGITLRRQSWPEKIALVLRPCGTEKAGLWFTHKAIVKRLQDQGHEDAPKIITQFLYGMVLSGYLDRAVKPDRGEWRPRQEYIYRRTAKPFKVKAWQGMKAVKMDDLHIGAQLERDHPRLPKWFRDMMK